MPDGQTPGRVGAMKGVVDLLDAPQCSKALFINSGAIIVLQLRALPDSFLLAYAITYVIACSLYSMSVCERVAATSLGCRFTCRLKVPEISVLKGPVASRQGHWEVSGSL